MLKWLITTPLYMARRIAKNQRIPSTHQEQQQSIDEKKGTAELEYKIMKQKFQSIDKQDAQLLKDDQNLQRSFNFIKNMIKEEERKESNNSLLKQKPTISQKLRKIGTPQELIVPKQTKNQPKTKDKPQETKLIESIVMQSGTNLQNLQKQMNRDLLLAQQDLMLQEIMSKSKEKEVKLDAPNNEVLDPKEQEKRLILRKEKILEALQKNTDPTQAKFKFTTEDLLSMKYSPEILAKAHQYKNKELGYFKQLISEDQSRNNRDSRLSKRHYKDEKDEQRYLKQLQEEKTPLVMATKQNSYKTLKHQEGLQLYQDQQFYRNKAIKQMDDRLSDQDLKLKEELKKDLDIGQKASDVFLDQVVYKKEAKLQKRIIYKQSSFGRQDTQIRVLDKKLKNLGIEFSREQIKSLSAQLLFEQKHFLEQQQGFQKYLQRKEKKKNMKTELRQAHKTLLRDDLNFDKQEQPSLSIKEIRQSSDMHMLEDNYQKLQEYEARKQSVLVQETYNDKQTQIHRKKTFRNMENFIVLYFGNGLSNHNISQLQEIELLQVIPNSSNTVMNIFWNISKDHLQKKGILPGTNDYQDQFEKEKKKIEARLKKQSTYLSGKMTQFLKLRYGPQIRFYFDTKTNKTIEAIEELSKYTKEIAMVQLQQYQKKGLVKTQAQSVEYYEKLVDVAKGKVFQFNSRKQLLSKKYQKIHKVQEKVTTQDKEVKQESKAKKKKRKNPIHEEEFITDGSNNEKMELRKKKASDRLWDSIDLL